MQIEDTREFSHKFHIRLKYLRIAQDYINKVSFGVKIG